eukprot:UN14757
MRLIKDVSPKQVMLVHGEHAKMVNLSKKIRGEMGIPTFYPPNGEWTEFDTWNRIPVNISTKLLEDVKSRRLKRKRVQDQFEIEQINEVEPDKKKKKIPKEISTDSKPFSAVFVLDNKNSEMKLRVVRKEDAIFDR